MPFVRVPYRAAPIAPLRPVIPSQQILARQPVAQRHLPVLQPPTFYKQSDFLFETEGQEHDETHDRPPIIDHGHHRKVTQQISVRVPTFIPQQNYPKQPVQRLSTRPIRHAEPKYPSYFYSPK
jgi:hypothetical protein